jgi:hypothetical protein
MHKEPEPFKINGKKRLKSKPPRGAMKSWAGYMLKQETLAEMVGRAQRVCRQDFMVFDVLLHHPRGVRLLRKAFDAVLQKKIDDVLRTIQKEERKKRRRVK